MAGPGKCGRDGNGNPVTTGVSADAMDPAATNGGPHLLCGDTAENGSTPTDRTGKGRLRLQQWSLSCNIAAGSIQERVSILEIVF